MSKIIESEAYTPHFSGHETFPLRQMWLKKDLNQKGRDNTVDKNRFSDESAIARFGVGKNMVSAIRHWAIACRVLEDQRDSRMPYGITEFGKEIFDDAGLDPYSDQLLHGSCIGA